MLALAVALELTFASSHDMSANTAEHVFPQVLSNCAGKWHFYCFEGHKSRKFLLIFTQIYRIYKNWVWELFYLLFFFGRFDICILSRPI